MSAATKTAVLLLNMGGPSELDEVGDYLRALFTDPELIPLPWQSLLGPFIAGRRTPKVRARYDEIGGGSPARRYTEAHGQLLAAALDVRHPEGAPHRAFIGFRYAAPRTHQALDAIAESGAQRVVVLSQYPQWACPTAGSSLSDLERGLEERPQLKALDWWLVDRWYAAPALVDFHRRAIEDALEQAAAAGAADPVLVFSAHSLPIKVIQRGDPYPQESGASVAAIMAALGEGHRYLLSYQSAVGPVQWLGPQTKDVAAVLGSRGESMVLVPISFVTDHIETLHELDLDIAPHGRAAGAPVIVRSACPNDDPVFAEQLADFIVAQQRLGRRHSPQFALRCPGCRKPQCRSIISIFSDKRSS